MKKVLVILALLIFVVFNAGAAQEYDLGSGKVLIRYDDGTYEVVEKFIDPSVVIGKQFVLDYDLFIDDLISIVFLEDPSLAALGKEYFKTIIDDIGIEKLIGTELPNISFIFLSETKAYVNMTGEVEMETTYRINPSRKLIMENAAGEETEIGTFSEDFKTLRVLSEGIYLVFKAI